MPNAGSELYFEWLQERGLSETPVANAAGVFLHDISPERSTLLVALVSPETATADLELLKRLASAMGANVSMLAASSLSDVPWRMLMDIHHSITQLVLLGDGMYDQLVRSGIATKLPPDALIQGAAPSILNIDITAKRDLWQKIQQRRRLPERSDG